MAKVEKLRPGKDGIVRAAVVRTLDKAKRPVSLKRAIRTLYPLEVTSDVHIVHELNQLDVKSEERDPKDISILGILFIFYLGETLVSELLFVCYDLSHAESIMGVCMKQNIILPLMYIVL